MDEKLDSLEALLESLKGRFESLDSYPWGFTVGLKNLAVGKGPIYLEGKTAKAALQKAVKQLDYEQQAEAK